MHLDGDLLVIALSILTGGIAFPLVRAWVRRIERAAPPPSLATSSEVIDRLSAIESAVEAIAVEVERISENQRFTTKLLAGREGVALPAAPVSGRQEIA